MREAAKWRRKWRQQAEHIHLSSEQREVSEYVNVMANERSKLMFNNDIINYLQLILLVYGGCSKY